MRARYEVPTDGLDSVTLARLREAAQTVEIEVLQVPGIGRPQLIILDDRLDDRARALLSDEFERLRCAIERGTGAAA
jgi:hypothetical protein